MMIPHPRKNPLPDGNHLVEPRRDQQPLVKGRIVVENFLDVFIFAGSSHFAHDDPPRVAMLVVEFGKCQFGAA